MTYLRHFAYAALVLLLAGCSLADVFGGAPEPIEGGLILRVGEDRPGAYGDAPTAPVPTLYLRTEEIYPCFNYRIVVERRRTGTVLDLAVEGTEIGNVCLTALGPAVANVALDVPEGTYLLRLRHLGRTDVYRLMLTADQIALEVVEAKVSSTEATLVWRFPVRSFGYYCGTLADEAFLCEDFAQRLHEALPLTPLDVPDAGEWPYPLESSGYYYDAPAQFYVYEREEDFQRAGALLGDYARDVLRNHEGDGLSLVNWRGEAFYSWVLEHGGA